jgi:hypothetical protein
MLRDVADDILKDIDLSGGMDEEGASARVMNDCINMCMSFHTDAMLLSHRLGIEGCGKCDLAFYACTYIFPSDTGMNANVESTLHLHPSLNY